MSAVWKYSCSDYVLETNWDTVTLSNFDEAFQECWNRKQAEHVFNYKLNIRKTKFLGKHRLFLQLKPERGSHYRTPQNFESLHPPFNLDAFNFTKIKEAEKMFELKNQDLKGKGLHMVVVNVSPLQRGHSLILPSMYDCLPQCMNEESLRISLDVLLLSASPALRIVYNSPCAFASVNHLHFHVLYFDEKMQLETIAARHLTGPCYELVSFPSKGFMFELTRESPKEFLTSSVFKLVQFFQKRNVAHNLCMTRGRSQKFSPDSNEGLRDCIRVYVWARTPSYDVVTVMNYCCNATFLPSYALFQDWTMEVKHNAAARMRYTAAALPLKLYYSPGSRGAKNSYEINPAACELFGLITAKSEEAYENMMEEDAVKIMVDTTKEMFESVRNDVKLLFSERD